MFSKLAIIEAKIDSFEEKLNEVDDKLDNLEQYGRSNCLICNGTEINPDLSYNDFVNELLIILNDKLNLSKEVTEKDIDIITHPLPRNKKRQHPIIVKFLQWSTQN